MPKKLKDQIIHLQENIGIAKSKPTYDGVGRLKGGAILIDLADSQNILNQLQAYHELLAKNDVNR